MLWGEYYKVYFTPKEPFATHPLNQQDHIDLLPFPGIEWYQANDQIEYEADKNGKIIYTKTPGVPIYLRNLTLGNLLEN